MEFNADTHRRRSLRLEHYDYAQAGAYFVTIATQGRVSLFGRIENGVIHLSEVGDMVTVHWLAVPGRFPNVALDAFVAMPNHIHGIIVIESHPHSRRGEPCVRPYEQGDDKQGDDKQGDDKQGDDKHRPYRGARGTAEGSLGRVVQAFKSLTTHAYIQGVRECGWPPFEKRLWQRNYFEHVIRNEGDLNAIREYIATNPLRWFEDKENPEVADV
jgi:REP element-mobilizing transposase RayT